MCNPFLNKSAKYDTNRLQSVLIGDQITATGNEIRVNP